MRTAFFCNLIPNKLGAFERLLVTLGESFQTGGDSLTVIFADEPIDELAGLLREAGVSWETIPGWSEGEEREHPWAFALPAAKIVNRLNPDVAVVHFGNEWPSLAARALSRLRGAGRTRWVWQQDQQISDPSRVTRSLSSIRAVSICFDHMVAVYEGGRESMMRRGIPADKVSVIYNAIRDHAPDRATGWLRNELGVDEGTPLVVNVGWQIPRKRIDFVIHAMARLTGDIKPALVQVGEGPQRHELEALAEREGIRDRVHFLGLRNDVRDVLAECDLLVHASLAETCTYVISESMSVSIPAVVTDAGAAREQIVDDVTGYVVERDDSAGFIERLGLLTSDGERRARFGTAARQRWEDRYRVEVSAGKYYELYRRLASMV
jgi:glycosyltransferase involved in cell wall biosynthesis